MFIYNNVLNEYHPWLLDFRRISKQILSKPYTSCTVYTYIYIIYYIKYIYTCCIGQWQSKTTASSIAQWYSAGFECGRSQVQSPSQGLRHTKNVIKMVPVVPLFSTEHSKGKKMALSHELKQENIVMDRIWYRNPSKSEVIGRWGRGEKNK